MTKLVLYEIAADVEAALMADDFDADALTALVQTMEAKAGAVVAFSDKLQAFADHCKAEEKRIAEKRKFAENRATRIKEYLHSCMDAAGMVEITVGTKIAKIQKNPHKVVVDNEEAIPAKFVLLKQTTQLDKTAIKDALKAGDVVDGARLEQGFSLRIK